MGESSNFWADMIRVATLFYGLFTVYFSISIMVTFKKRNPPKLIKQHVLRISLTYIGLVTLAMIDISLRFGQSLTYRSPVLLVLLSAAMSAQFPLLQYERQRLNQNTHEQKMFNQENHRDK